MPNGTAPALARPDHLPRHLGCQPWCTDHDDGDRPYIKSVTPADAVCHTTVPAPGGEIHVTRTVEDGVRVSVYAHDDLALPQVEELHRTLGDLILAAREVAA